MANLRDIRRRIRSVKNTSQITRAMQLVAASKMKKAQDQAVAGRTYASHLNGLLANLKGEQEEMSHPLLEQGNPEKPGILILVSTDKGLCGGLNTNLFKKVLAESDRDTTRYVSIGTKGTRFLAKTGRDLAADFPVRDPVHFNEVKKVSRFAVKAFLDGEASGVRVAFTNFVNTLTQTPHIAQLLPLDPEQVGAAVGDAEPDYLEKADAAGMASVSTGGSDRLSDYLFEPGKAEFFGKLLPLFVNHLFYQMVLEARASEHSARMVAMKNATDNAKGIIKDLTLEYNKLRQAAITNELLEISTAQMALG